MNAQPQFAFRPVDADPHRSGPCMLADVGQHFLDDAKQVVFNGGAGRGWISFPSMTTSTPVRRENRLPYQRMEATRP